MKYTHLWEEVENAGRLYNVEFSIDFDVSPFVPAKINCDPDDGHPAEGGEVVIDDIAVLSVCKLDAKGASVIEWLAADVSPVEKFYWTERFEREQIDADFEMELSEYAAQQEEEARQTEDFARYDTMRERDE